MTEQQAYKKKKDTLLLLFMFLLLVFVGLMCFIVIYAKEHPKNEYDDPSTIEIKKMSVSDYEQSDNLYTEVTDSTEFFVTSINNQISLEVTDGVIYAIDNSKEEKTKIILYLNNTDINNDIKLIYQTNSDNLILTNNGNLYRLSDTYLTEENTLSVGQILNNYKVSSIVTLQVPTEDTYILTNDNKIININTNEEYTGIINKITLDEGTIYVYSDYSFGLEPNKVFVNDSGRTIKFNILFNNLLVDDLNTFYEIDFSNKTLTTSSLGKLSTIAYNNETSIYKIKVVTNTGLYNYESNYYYTR